MAEPQPPAGPVFNFQVPDDLAAGVYSNVVMVWHSPYEFTIDFAVTQPAQATADEAGNQVLVVPARVVARVKIPPAQVFELAKALSTNERLYEEHIGPIPKPGRPEDEPPAYPPEP